MSYCCKMSVWVLKFECISKGHFCYVLSVVGFYPREACRPWQSPSRPIPVLSEIQLSSRYENLLSFSPFPNNNHSLGHFTSFWRQSLLNQQLQSRALVGWNKNSLWKVCIQRALHVELIGYCKTKTFFKKTFWNKNFLWNVGLQYVLHVDPIGYEKASSLIAPSTDVTHRRQIWGRK